MVIILKKNNCCGCPYLKDDTKVVDSIHLDKPYLIVMQSPGESENKVGKPLSSKKKSSATYYLSKCLPKGKKLDDYAIAELVRCKPRVQGEPCLEAIAICYRYLEEEMVTHKFKKIYCLCKYSISIVKNIKERNNLECEIVEGKYPDKRFVSEEELKNIMK